MRKRHQDENEPAAGPIPAALRHPKSGPWTTPSDVAIALAFFFLSMFGLPPSEDGVVQGASPTLFLLMAGVCALAMVVRRHSPMIFVLVAGVCLSAHLVLLPGPTLFFTMVAFVAVETTQSRLEAPWRWVGLALELAGAAMMTVRLHGLIGDYVHGGMGRLMVITNAWLLVAVVAFVGVARRRSRDRYNQAFERAALLEAQQATERRLAVVETQQRIARDVHDLLGHTLTVIAMQAEGARAILATDPAAADEALAVIGETSRRSVDEVRALVDILRSEAAGSEASDGVAAASAVGAGGTGAGAGPADETAEAVDAGTGTFAGTGPAASSHDHERDLLREPVRQAQHAGLPVTLETDPTERLPPAAAQVFHRVAQESLTNVLRHAPGATTTVSLSTGIGRAVLAVENAPAPKARAASSAQAADAPEGSEGDGENGPVHRGFGLIGMRDRVAELGGSFTAGPTPEGGWRVMAELPVVPE